MAQLVGDRLLLRHDGTKVKGSEALAGKVVAFYFSGFCIGCIGFTSRLKDLYNKLKEAGKSFEVVQVACDTTQIIFHFTDDILEESGKWLVVPFGDPQGKEYMEKMKMSTVISVFKIHNDVEHALRIVKADGTVVSDFAMAEVDKNADGGDPMKLFEKWQKLCM